MTKYYRDAVYLVTLGLSLTLIMASALFILVGVNPKGAEYTNMPWIYSGICALLGILTNLYARSLGRTKLTEKSE